MLTSNQHAVNVDSQASLGKNTHVSIVANGNGCKATETLKPEHWEHLKNEGFAVEEINHLISLGVRSISEAEAKQKNFVCKNVDGEFVSSSGLYFPFSKSFGQIRCDKRIIIGYREDGTQKTAKYLTPCKAKSEAYLPKEAKVLTEGFKDALAGTLKGGIVTAALSGVSQYRSALEPGLKLTIVFDADGWTNPQVFQHLFNAGRYLKGKIQLIPKIEGEPKAGLCEYFKAGHSKDDFKALIDAAMEPEQFLMVIPKHWQGLSNEKSEQCKHALLKLAAIHLSSDQVQDVTDALAITRKDVEADLKKYASQKVEELRKECKFEDLAKLKGHYIWESIHSDKIFSDFMTLVRKFGNRLRFNTLKKQAELDGEVLPIGTAKVFLTVQHGLQIKSKTDYPDIVLSVAKMRQYSPIVEYLDSVHSKHGYNPEIIKNLAFRYFGQHDPIYNRMLVKTLIGAVARAYKPGCKMDTALILQGKQGARKSTFFKILAGGNDHFDDSLGSVGEKDERLKLHRSWFIEWAELETVFKKKDVAATKAFLSCCTDNVRPPYARDIEEMPRASIIVGSTNQDEFLSDSTGNRRFWIIPVLKTIDTDLLNKERDLIWSSVVELYKQGQQWWMTDIEEESAAKIAEQFQSCDPWTEDVLEFADDKDFVTINDILKIKLGIDTSRLDRGLQNRIASILKQNGFTKERKRLEGKQEYIWVKPSLDNPHQSELELDHKEYPVKQIQELTQHVEKKLIEEDQSRPNDLPEWVERGVIVTHKPTMVRFPIHNVKRIKGSKEYRLQDSSGKKYALKDCEPSEALA